MLIKEIPFTGNENELRNKLSELREKGIGIIKVDKIKENFYNLIKLVDEKTIELNYNGDIKNEEAISKELMLEMEKVVAKTGNGGLATSDFYCKWLDKKKTILKLSINSYNRNQYFVWDTKKNCKADLRKKEYKLRIKS